MSFFALSGTYYAISSNSELINDTDRDLTEHENMEKEIQYYLNRETLKQCEQFCATKLRISTVSIYLKTFSFSSSTSTKSCDSNTNTSTVSTHTNTNTKTTSATTTATTATEKSGICLDDEFQLPLGGLTHVFIVFETVSMFAPFVDGRLSVQQQHRHSRRTYYKRKPQFFVLERVKEGIHLSLLMDGWNENISERIICLYEYKNISLFFSSIDIAIFIAIEEQIAYSFWFNNCIHIARNLIAFIHRKALRFQSRHCIHSKNKSKLF